MMKSKRASSLAAVAALCVLSWPTTAVLAKHLTGWSEPQKVDEIAGNSSEVNTTASDGCPMQSPDGLSLYMASNRPGGLGGLDIWVATRASADDGWGAPVNLGEPINSTANDFCPTPVRGNGLFFVSTRGGSCGMGDIFFARLNPKHGWGEPEHLGCAPNGPNTTLNEMGPSYFEIDGKGYLYFSSGTGTDDDIYVSEQLAGDGFGPAQAVSELNSADSDIQPNVRKDGREIVFASNHVYPGAQGGQDVYIASRASVEDPCSAPVNLTEANTAVSETRPSLSWDGMTLYFGRNPGPEGGSDIYVMTRQKATG